MTSRSDEAGLDPEIVVSLRELGELEGAADSERVDRMFASIERRCEKSDKTLPGFVRSRSTVLRRLIVLAVLAVLGIMGFSMFPLAGESVRGSRWFVPLAGLFALLLVAAMMVTRPVHKPAFRRWHVACLACVAIGATVLVAFWPGGSAQAAAAGEGAGRLAGACMGMGLLLGVPVYALFRLVDRGNALGALIAASAAGLAGNFALEAHCPVGTTEHILLGHASVAALFVLGVGLVHHWTASR